jgi:hypothetical protein
LSDPIFDSGLIEGSWVEGEVEGEVEGKVIKISEIMP